MIFILFLFSEQPKIFEIRVNQRHLSNNSIMKELNEGSSLTVHCLVKMIGKSYFIRLYEKFLWSIKILLFDYQQIYLMQKTIRFIKR